MFLLQGFEVGNESGLEKENDKISEMLCSV
jgi:hypothetical protein